MTCELKNVHTRQAKDEECPNRVCLCGVREREDVREREEVEELGDREREREREREEGGGREGWIEGGRERDGVCCV
jgi:hypothetical protein